MTEASGSQVVTVVTATIDVEREAELVEGFRAIVAAPFPDGLLRSELLRGQEGTWQVQSLWRDLASLQAVRASGVRPAALDLVERVGSGHSHSYLVVEQSVSAD